MQIGHTCVITKVNNPIMCSVFILKSILYAHTKKITFVSVKAENGKYYIFLCMYQISTRLKTLFTATFTLIQVLFRTVMIIIRKKRYIYSSSTDRTVIKKVKLFWVNREFLLSSHKTFLESQMVLLTSLLTNKNMNITCKVCNFFLQKAKGLSINYIITWKK